MTSKLVVNTIEADTGISSVSFGSSISLSSTSKFFFGAAGIDIGADTNINRPASGVLGFNINSSEKARIDSSGRLLLGTTDIGYTSFADNLTIADSANCGITLRSGTSNQGNIYFSDGTGTSADTYRGYITYAHADNDMLFATNSVERLRIKSDGNVLPASNNSYDLGSTSHRWRNIYTNDLNLSNEGSSNDVDGTWGNYTIQEGESDLFLINKRSGKKYKFNLTEV